MRPSAVKGTYDVLPDDQPRWHALLATTRRILGRAGVDEISTPVFEHSEVFEKSVGESADLVVQKEMYRFEDRGGRSLTLRPEFTAGVLRAFIEHGMHTWPAPVKLWSAGPAFRAENVQRGRFRQFHQVNCELVGGASALLDAEAIALLVDVLAGLGLRGVHVKVGSVGDPEDRQRYNAYLREALEPQAEALSEVSRERLRLNPLRVLDSKDAGDQALLAPLQRPLERLGGEARAHFDAVTAVLEAWGVPFEIDASIVRGLDYYRRTAFEVHHAGIGAQSALGGGGRYDGLIAQLGGPDVPGIGWAFGIERVFDALSGAGVAAAARERPLAYLVALDETAVAELAQLARALRSEHRIEHGYVARNPGKGLRDADRSGARLAVMRGSRERADGTFQVKDLRSGEQHTVPEDALAEHLRRSATGTTTDTDAALAG
ncbi:MAG: histidine--tRNA ligase [Trueperaceae bacterium]|nr:MAG: histidine--tRNA ligase [Trueperaceae bacterium]